MDSNAKIVPAPLDVLNGRGHGVQAHPGNVKFRKLVLANKVRESSQNGRPMDHSRFMCQRSPSLVNYRVSMPSARGQIR
jgi:hypothetical protein